MGTDWKQWFVSWIWSWSWCSSSIILANNAYVVTKKLLKRTYFLNAPEYREGQLTRWNALTGQINSRIGRLYISDLVLTHAALSMHWTPPSDQAGTLSWFSCGWLTLQALNWHWPVTLLKDNTFLKPFTFRLRLNMPPKLPTRNETPILYFIAADEYHDDSEKDFNSFVSNAEEASGVMEPLQMVSSCDLLCRLNSWWWHDPGARPYTRFKWPSIQEDMEEMFEIDATFKSTVWCPSAFNASRRFSLRK